MVGTYVLVQRSRVRYPGVANGIFSRGWRHVLVLAVYYQNNPVTALIVNLKRTVFAVPHVGKTCEKGWYVEFGYKTSVKNRTFNTNEVASLYDCRIRLRAFGFHRIWCFIFDSPPWRLWTNQKHRGGGIKLLRNDCAKPERSVSECKSLSTQDLASVDCFVDVVWYQSASNSRTHAVKRNITTGIKMTRMLHAMYLLWKSIVFFS